MLKQLQTETGWHHLDICLNGFSAFREVYGFLTADESLSLVATVLTEVVTELGTPNDFIGTPEEARFTVITHANDVEGIIKALTERFNERVKSLYNFMDAERGYIVLKPGTDTEARR